MVVVHLRGGLGNQMFQYALYLSFTEKGIPAALDLSHYKNAATKTSYELPHIFNINAPVVGELEKIFIKAKWKLVHNSYHVPYKETDDAFGFYNEKILSLRSAYLKGYWQTEQYFKDIAGHVKERFSLPAFTDKRNEETKQQAQQSNSVSLHIRRGDYLDSNRNWTISLNYYHTAISLIKEKVDDPLFFVFSDDPVWAAENIKISNAHFINWNNGADSYKDMQLMSYCRHNIIANSSFSWWGAWLNDNKEKIVIAPQQWLPWMEGTRDIIPGSWIKLIA
ncbi:MAG: alpha-1,2-fucosyltransferase [Ferruginibacter sp.]